MMIARAVEHVQRLEDEQSRTFLMIDVLGKIVVCIERLHSVSSREERRSVCMHRAAK